MKPQGLYAFVLYLKEYLRSVSLKCLPVTMLFVAVLVAMNYTIGIEARIRAIRPLPLSLLGFFLFYGFVFFGVWGIQIYFGGQPKTKPVPEMPGEPVVITAPKDTDRRYFLLLLLLAPLFFAVKMIHWDLSFLIPAGLRYPWNAYTLILLQLPAKLVLLFLMLAACRKIGGWGKPLVPGGSENPGVSNGWAGLGFTTKGYSLPPYLMLLLSLAPLVALASTQQDFLHAYPKFRNIAFINGYAHPLWPWRLLYEISYGLDFVSIELFFRGFLVIGLARWAGSGTILPMAAFYCTIHFGKPLGECISSFAGGLALGVIAWRTRSILGGLMIHLGLAWMMELGGWMGGLFRL